MKERGYARERRWESNLMNPKDDERKMGDEEGNEEKKEDDE